MSTHKMLGQSQQTLLSESASTVATTMTSMRQGTHQSVDVFKVAGVRVQETTFDTLIGSTILDVRRIVCGVEYRSICLHIVARYSHWLWPVSKILDYDILDQA